MCARAYFHLNEKKLSQHQQLLLERFVTGDGDLFSDLELQTSRSNFFRQGLVSELFCILRTLHNCETHNRAQQPIRSVTFDHTLSQQRTSASSASSSKSEIKSPAVFAPTLEKGSSGKSVAFRREKRRQSLAEYLGVSIVEAAEKWVGGVLAEAAGTLAMMLHGNESNVAEVLRSLIIL